MSDDVLPQSTFNAVLDGLIPARDEKIPGAGSLGLGDYVAARLGDADDRPLLAGLDSPGRRERLGALRAERACSYGAAEVRIATDGRSPEEVCDAVLVALGWEHAA